METALTAEKPEKGAPLPYVNADLTVLSTAKRTGGIKESLALLRPLKVVTVKLKYRIGYYARHVLPDQFF